MRKGLLAGGAMLVAAHSAQATVIATTSLYAPSSSTGTVSALKVAGISTPSEATVATPAYTVSFAGVTAGQGVVNGSMGGAYAQPVAGIVNGAAAFFTGDYGSALTTDASAAGNYLSTGTGSILVSFAQTQRSLELLWGSIDNYNSIAFLDGAGNVLDTLSGSTVLALTGNGAQSLYGGAYVTATESNPFSAVRFNSSAPSFEFAGVAASTGVFNVPEPLSLSVFGSGLVMAGMVRRRRRGQRAA